VCGLVAFLIAAVFTSQSRVRVVGTVAFILIAVEVFFLINKRISPPTPKLPPVGSSLALWTACWLPIAIFVDTRSVGAVDALLAFFMFYPFERKTRRVKTTTDGTS
jgi:hypothetical protein